MTLTTSYQSDDDVFYVGDNLTLTCSTSVTPGSGVNYQLGIVFDDISNSSDDEIINMSGTICNTVTNSYLRDDVPQVISVVDRFDRAECSQLNEDVNWMSITIKVNESISLYRIHCVYSEVLDLDRDEIFNLPNRQIYGEL